MPAHETMGDLFARLDPEPFEQGFLAWVQTMVQLTQGEIIAVAGKCLRRAHARTLGKAAMLRVSA